MLYKVVVTLHVYMWTKFWHLNIPMEFYISILLFFKVVLRSKNTYFFFGFQNVVYETHPMRNLGLNFEKKTVYLNYNISIYWSAIITPERIQWRQLLNELCVNTAY